MATEVEAMLLRGPQRNSTGTSNTSSRRRDTGCEAIVKCLAHGFGNAGTIRGAGATDRFALSVEG